MLFFKYFITQGVISNKLADQYFPVKFDGNLENHLNIISKEMSNIREKFTEAYNLLSSYNLCKEYSDFLSNNKIEIDTLTIGSQEKFSLLFSHAMTRISSSINILSSNPTMMNMNNRDTYELMYNLLNEYYRNWKTVHVILLNDSINATKFKNPLMIIFLAYFFISFILLYFFLKLLAKF